jgi:quercetin 2,3-dioxygenase
MKKTLDRRSILQTAGIAAGAGAVAFLSGWPRIDTAFAQTTGQAPQMNPSVPDDVLNPVEVSGPEAVPIIGELPGARRMYVLPDGKGEYHLIGSQVMTRIARPQETGGTYELATFAGVTGATMPRHTHLASHTALVLMAGDVELELNGQRWRMLRGDFANIPAGTPHSWTMRSDRGRIALFMMGDRVGAAYVAMGTTTDNSAPPSGGAVPIDNTKLAQAAMAGDFQLAPSAAPSGDVVRVSNLLLPATTGPYVLLDGGGERYGGNTFCAKDANTNGQFLFIMSEGGGGGGVGAHFHARHAEDFFALDGETMVWAYGKAVPLKSGDFVQAPPRNMHGFKMMQPYNRFVGFLTPGIFENFFTHGQAGQNGVGGRGAGEGAVNAGRGGNFGGQPNGGANGRGFAGRGAGGDMFRALMMSGVGPDGYPLDVHGPTMPLPPQDPIWTTGQQTSLNQQLLLREHGKMLCGGTLASRVISPELKRALALKPKAKDFV